MQRNTNKNFLFTVSILWKTMFTVSILWKTIWQHLLLFAFLFSVIQGCHVWPGSKFPEISLFSLTNSTFNSITYPGCLKDIWTTQNMISLQIVTIYRNYNDITKWNRAHMNLNWRDTIHFYCKFGLCLSAGVDQGFWGFWKRCTGNACWAKWD